MHLKRISFDKEAKDGLRAGITTLAKAVKSTLGPRGRTVIIEAEDILQSRTVTKDGATVAKYVNSEDSNEDMAINIMRDAATKTAKEAGDGTTTSIVLTEAIINSYDEVMTNNSMNPTKVIEHLKDISDEIIKNLDESSIKIDDGKLKQIATISANNDSAIGELIHDAYKSAGEGGVVLVENGQDATTTFTKVEGISFDRGFTSTYQINNRENQTIEMNNVFILITDKEIEDLRQIDGILSNVIANKLNLLIIGEMTLRAQALLNKNVAEQILKAAFVLPPHFGYRRTQILEDIALATGGTYFSEQTGDDWSSLTFDKLGRAERIVIDQSSTTIIDSSERNVESRHKRIEELKAQIENTKDDLKKEDLEHRLALLSGSVVRIKVGGATDLEMKERKDRVDDAVLAAKAALEGGILPGAGLSLLKASERIEPNSDSTEYNVANKILKQALKAPFNQILVNAGVGPRSIMSNRNFDMWSNKGYNLNTREFGDLIEMGVIDPTKVTKTALKNAVAVASTIIGSPVVITNLRANNGN